MVGLKEHLYINGENYKKGLNTDYGRIESAGAQRGAQGLFVLNTDYGRIESSSAHMLKNLL